jgi:hypothetical protein
MLRGPLTRAIAVVLVSATLVGGSLSLGLGLGQASAAITPYQVAVSGTVPNAELVSGSASIGNITVDIEDDTGATGPTTASYTITLTIGTNPTGATLTCVSGTASGSGSSTAWTLSAGTTGSVTFTGCTLNKTGNGFTLAVSASGGPPSVFSTTSNPFNVTGPPDHLGFTQGPSTVVAGSSTPQDVLVSVLDANGNVVTTDNSDVVALSLVSPPAGASLTCTASGFATGVTAVDGVVNFGTCSINHAGTYTLEASYVSGPTLVTDTVTTPWVVTNPSRLVFTQGPVDTSVGASQTIQVSVEDSAGNVDTGDTSTYSVTLAVSSGPSGGTVSCTTNPVLDTNGVATFSCDFPVSGTYQLIATASPVLAPVTSSSFTVAAAAAKLSFIEGPMNTTVNVGQTIQVAVEDGFGDVVTTDTSTVISLAIETNAGGGTLTCSPSTPVSGVTVSNGVATFSGCAIDAPGTGYTLVATATANPPTNATVISSSFSIFATGYSVVTLPATSVSTTSAVLNGSFPGGVGSTWDFEYGTTPSLGTEVGPFTVTSATSPLSVSALVTGLTPNQTYYFQLFTSAGPGTGPLSFFTGAQAVVTDPATSVGATSAVLNGTVNPGGAVQTCSYLYGTSSTLTGAASTTNFNTTAGTVPVSEPVPVTGLSPSTTYYFELQCTNGNGGILSFTTSSAGSVVTQAATSVGATSAVLNGTVNPGGAVQTCSYLYGTSSTLTGAASTSSFSTTAVTTVLSEPVPVTGLSPSTTYYFELQCTNGNGGILSFTTSAGSQITQLYGQDPIGTAIAISQAEFPANGSAQAVVLARDDFFSDALAGGPLAAAVDGPMLLTEGAPESATLDPRTEAEIERVLAPGGTVYVLGGDLAIAPGVDTTLTSLGYTVVREAGSDEFATAVDIAQQLGNPNTIFEATGLSFYDALSAVPAAIANHAAILLTDGATQAPETAAYLAAHPTDTRYAIGGPLAAAGADPGATAVYGADLYATSAAVASTFFPHATLFGAATSLSFTDALGGGVYMATGGRAGPLLIVNPSAPLPPEILPYLASLTPGTPGVVFGGPLAVGPDVVAALAAAVG